MEELLQIIILEVALGVDQEALDDSGLLPHHQIQHSPFHLPHLNLLPRTRCLLPSPPLLPLLHLQLLQTGLISCFLSPRSLHSPVGQSVGDQEEGLREREKEREEKIFHNLIRVSESKCQLLTRGKQSWGRTCLPYFFIIWSEEKSYQT